MFYNLSTMPSSDCFIKTARRRAGLILLLACVAINCGAALVAEFPIPIAGTQPEAITRGPDGAYWFAGFNGNYIGRITPGGSITHFSILKPGSQPFGLAVGPDNNLWFTEFGGNKIGCVTTNGVLVGEFTI